MKIIDREPLKCSFSNLNQGDVFKNKEDEYCMKIEPCCDCDAYVNFITLSDGAIGGWMKEDECVIKVNCELIIKQ